MDGREDLTPLERDLIGDLNRAEKAARAAHKRLADTGKAFGAVEQLIERGNDAAAQRLAKRYERWLAGDHEEAIAE